MRQLVACLTLLPFGVGLGSAHLATKSAQDFTEAEQTLIDVHCPYGLPSVENVLVRQGYVTAYDPARRIPRWSAYHAHPDYRRTPKRKSRFKSFRQDPDVSNPVKDDDYLGLFSVRGFARGHLAPYFIMGGDRDGDDQLAKLAQAHSDPDDELTIFESNYMSNVVPQHHGAFNGIGGVWFDVESMIRNQVDDGFEMHVIAGCVLGPGSMERVGPDDDIEVPPAFFQIVAYPTEEGEFPQVLAFLLPHHRMAHGDPEDFLVSVDVIEALTGLDFFSELEDETEEWLEDLDTFENWDG